MKVRFGRESTGFLLNIYSGNSLVGSWVMERGNKLEVFSD